MQLRVQKKGYLYKPLLTIFKANYSYIRCIVYSINLSAQAIFTCLKSIAKKHTSVLYNNTRFTKQTLYTSAIGKTC
jgi:hypothetical protein